MSTPSLYSVPVGFQRALQLWFCFWRQSTPWYLQPLPGVQGAWVEGIGVSGIGVRKGRKGQSRQASPTVRGKGSRAVHSRSGQDVRRQYVCAQQRFANA
jgi:hypothetical protein